MAGYKVHVMIAVLFFLVLVEIGAGLNCYNCTQVKNSHCKDKFEKEHVDKVTCPVSQVCVKHKRPGITLEVTAQHAKNLTSNIVRGCKPKDYCDQVGSFSEHCSSCTTDLCNSSSELMPSFIVIALYVAKNVFL